MSEEILTFILFLQFLIVKTRDSRNTLRVRDHPLLAAIQIFLYRKFLYRISYIEFLGILIVRIKEEVFYIGKFYIEAFYIGRSY